MHSLWKSCFVMIIFTAFFLCILYHHDYFYCIHFIHPVSSWLFLIHSFYTSCIIMIVFNTFFLDILIVTIIFYVFFWDFLYHHDYFWCIVYRNPVSFLMHSLHTSFIIKIIFDDFFGDVLYHQDHFWCNSCIEILYHQDHF